MIATIAEIAAIANKNGLAIPAIDGFHMIAAIAEWRPRGPGSNSIVRAIPQLLLEACFLVIMGVFRRRRRR